ncbi:MAG: adenosylcobinamide-GDP ribazoletransferase [Candidatus Binatus sp.]|uniref:adenosylcobinamide-GDP ribazoletransferase n=2 Tax=Candidatus Binatus sp. TaxID=2811406 RepID=UPI003BAEFDE2
MSDEATPAGGFWTELPLAISFLTILPVIDQRPASDETVSASFAWFPIVGCLIGLALAGEDWLLAHFFAQVVRSVLIVLSLTVLTGAVHLDGLADTADALGAGRDRKRALDILHDSRVGTFGASAIFFDLTLKILALSTLAGARRYAALIIAPTLARFAMVMVGVGIPYLRESGAGTAFLNSQSLGWRRRVAVIFLIIECAILLSPFRTVGTLAVSVALLIAFLMHLFYRRWLGGVTGDLIGACGEVIEIVVLLTMSL